MFSSASRWCSEGGQFNLKRLPGEFPIGSPGPAQLLFKYLEYGLDGFHLSSHTVLNLRRLWKCCVRMKYRAQSGSVLCWCVLRRYFPLRADTLWSAVEYKIYLERWCRELQSRPGTSTPM